MCNFALTLIMREAARVGCWRVFFATVQCPGVGHCAEKLAIHFRVLHLFQI